MMTDPDLQKFRKLDNDNSTGGVTTGSGVTAGSRPTAGALRRSSLDLADLNMMSKEVTAAKEVRNMVHIVCLLFVKENFALKFNFLI